MFNFLICKRRFRSLVWLIECRSGDTETVKILVDHGAKINRLNRDSESPLFLAAENAQTTDADQASTEIVKFLIDR